MSDQRKSGIEWTDQTWNPIRGCSKVSQGCKHCYAETMAARFSKPGQPYEMVITNGRWNGDVVLVPDHLADPLRWQRPRRVFVNSMSDLFHEAMTFETIAAVFGVMASAQRHTFQVLTKRPARALEFFAWLESAQPPQRQIMPGEFLETVLVGSPRQTVLVASFARMAMPAMEAHRIDVARDLAPSLRAHPWPLPNVWLGVSIEDQATADERIPLLLQCPAAVRWVSAEPLLGPGNLRSSAGGTLWIGGQRGCGATHHGEGTPECPREMHHHHDDRCKRGIDWVVVGGESGPGARPMHLDWARSLRDQCVEADVPFLFKQWGDWAPYDTQYRAWVDSMSADSRRWHGDTITAHQWDDGTTSYRIGKKTAGRALDGKVWDQYPGDVTP